MSSLTVALTDLLGQPGAPSKIAYALLPYLSAMQTIVFHDNEYGDVACADVKLERAVRIPVARWLVRQRSPIGMLRIKVNHKRRHSLDISYKLRDVETGVWGEEVLLAVAVFTPSDRARAKERAEIESGEAGERQGPRRGAKGGGNGRRKRKKIEAASK